MTTPAQPIVNIEGLSPAAAAAVVKLSRNLANSKDINDRIQFYDLAAKADPSIEVPADIQMERFRREQTAMRENDKIEETKKATLRKQEQDRQALISSGRYDEATVKKIEDEIMTTRGISDYEVAATLYAHANPEPSVNPPVRGQAGATWDMPWTGQSKENVSRLMANPRKVALEKAHEVVSEIRKKRA